MFSGAWFHLRIGLGVLLTITTACSPIAFSQGLSGSPSNKASLAVPTLSVTPQILTAAQQQRVQSLTPAQQQQYVNAIQPTLANLKNQITANQVPADIPLWPDLIAGIPTASNGVLNSSIASSTFSFSNPSGTNLIVTATRQDVHGLIAKDSSGQPQVFLSRPPIACPAWGCNGCPPTTCHPPVLITPSQDLDQDGLADAFESQVADAFTPLYGVSSGEQDQFATFGNYIPMTITSLVGTVPPYSYYRVQPLGPGTDAKGNPVFALRIDYLTLWNADNGLVSNGAACLYSYVGLDGVIGQLTGHDLDVERSVVLLAAPLVNGSYNPNPNAYSLYTLYTAAHEGTFFDQSAYASFFPAVPANNHINLALSLSKHSTYTFNPSGYPITPEWFIASYNLSLASLYADGEISDNEFYLSEAIGDNVFFGCIVEQWANEGSSYANTRTNVGEPAHPINGSTFIQDDSARALYIRDKLTNPVF